MTEKAFAGKLVTKKDTEQRVNTRTSNTEAQMITCKGKTMNGTLQQS